MTREAKTGGIRDKVVVPFWVENVENRDANRDDHWRRNKDPMTP